MVQGRESREVSVIGAGLAGCEAALQCARRGVPVRLYEMRPTKMTEAHQTGDVAELVCSNSLKSDEPENAHGLLKAELRILGSVLLECAERARVPGGKALVVDRRLFSTEVQSELSRAGVSVERVEVSSLPVADSLYRPRFGLSDPHQPTVDLGTDVDRSSFIVHRSSGRADDVTVIATGPLTSSLMADALQALLGTEHLFFYDAIAPIVEADSLDRSRVFEGSRYGAGSDYLNCPMTEEDYDRFITALLEAELHPLHEFEENALGKQGTVPQSACVELGAGQSPFSETHEQGLGTKNKEPRTFFEGCLPVEEIARRGRLALAFGPMKPVGLVDPHTGMRPFAVVQLRRENAEGTMYNLVGFQTRLRQGEQERVFRTIPGLEHAAFLRFGSIHRNTFLDSPRLLLPTLQARARPELLIAGQLTGVEGYVESIGAGLVAGINAARLASGGEPQKLPREMMLGSLLACVSGGDLAKQAEVGTAPVSVSSALAVGQLRSVADVSPSFQPMNANFGLLPPLSAGTGHAHAPRLRGRDKRRAMAERALATAREFALTLVDKRG